MWGSEKCVVFMGMRERGFWWLRDLASERLVRELKGLLAAECRIEARVVAHLAELDARGVALLQGKSLWEYCQKDLGLSENQAFYRITAARTARRFPVVFELLERREIHLTTVALLSRYLTRENHRELLGEARGKSKREVLKLLACRSPKPEELSRIRALPPGTVAAGPTGTLEPRSASHYRLELDVDDAFLQELEQVRDLMSHANPSGNLTVVLRRALEVAKRQLLKDRFGQVARPRTGKSERTGRREVAERGDRRQTESGGADLGRPNQSGHLTPFPLRRRRRIRSEVRRLLIERDGLGCSYCGPDGARCGETAFLQIHHLAAWAKGGSDELDNLKLVCAAHNRWLAEIELGPRRVTSASTRIGVCSGGERAG